jgi:TrmH family RNA methyltransferase
MTKKAWADNVFFILVAPTEPGNIGAAARAIKNMGFRNLELVNPVPYATPEARAMACGASDILERARVYPTLREAVGEKSLVAGTTRRRGSRRGIIVPVAAAAKEIAKVAAGNKVAILFGNEHNGLTNREIEACGLLATIPSDPGAPSLNLGQSVMLVAYELSRAAPVEAAPPLVGSKEIQDLMKRVRGTLDILGYGKKGDRDLRADIMRNIRRLVGRAGLTAWELGMIHGLCRRIREKTGTSPDGPDRKPAAKVRRSRRAPGASGSRT